MAMYLGSQRVSVVNYKDYNKGHIDGQQAEYDRFWDAYQNYGKRGHYRYAFYRPFWNDENFKPKYDIKPAQDGQYIFQQCGVTDMKAILQRQGVTLDFSATPMLYYCFSNAAITYLPELDCSKCNNFQNMFINCTSLVSIDKLIISEKATGTNFARMFDSCSALENVIFEGVIAADISLGDSPLLSHDSIMSLLNCMKTGGTGTVTLGATNLAKLTDTEKAIATEKGWTLV